MVDREAQWGAWMRSANAGDAEAYRSLLSDLCVDLRRLARRGLERAGQPGADAEDIVQETLLAIHQKRHTWDPEQPVGPWLRGIARHKLVDALRRKRRHVPIDDFVEQLAAEDEGPDFRVRDVTRLARELPESQRAVLLAVAVEGASRPVVARRFGLTDGALRVALHRAVARLARLAEGKR